LSSKTLVQTEKALLQVCTFALDRRFDPMARTETIRKQKNAEATGMRFSVILEKKTPMLLTRAFYTSK